jgi:hypothetical protein
LKKNGRPGRLRIKCFGNENFNIMIKPVLRIIFLFILFINSPVIIFSQKIVNPRFEQSGKQIIIYYDLEGSKPSQTYDIQIFCSTDGGITFGKALTKVTGNVGPLSKAGIGSRIVWEVLSERENLIGNVMFEIRWKKSTPSILENRRIEGSVKSVIETDYNASMKGKNLRKEEMVRKYTAKYDKSGIQLFGESLRSDATLLYRSTFLYDEKGNRTESTFQSSNSSSPTKTKYLYDENGRRTGYSIYTGDGSLSEKVEEYYNEKGERFEYKSFDSTGKLISMTLFEYDENSKIIEYNYQNKLDSSKNANTKYKYDSQGNTIEFCRYKPDGSISLKTTSKFDEFGNEIEYITYNPDGSINRKETYKFNEHKEIIEDSVFKPDGILDYKDTYVYSSFDNTGNWLVKTTSRNGITNKITERQIEYY